MSKIIQTIPAVGWSAAFRDEETKTKGDTRALVGWALNDDGTVVGLVVENGDRVSPVGDTVENFMSYHFSGSTSAMTK
ncbi:MAG TPA: hypothetical protein VGM51_04005 [Armatimonadota bacterium]